jgi:nitrogen-specific signal transduction histidine kinase
MYKREVLPIVYNLVIEEMSNPVIVTDSKDKLMYLNDAGKKLLGLEEIRFLQQDIRDVFKSLYDFSLIMVSDKRYFEFEDLIYQVGVYSVEDWQRVNRSVIFVLDDVTELVKYSRGLEVMVEEKTSELLDSERLAAIGKMTSMVGHDLRNPLQVIRLIGGKLEERRAPSVTALPRVFLRNHHPRTRSESK